MNDELHRLLEQFKDLFTKYEALKQQQQQFDPLFLPNDICPDGFEPCDAMMEVCPEEGPYPPMYTVSGARCYESGTIAHARHMKKNDQFEVNIREFVENAAALLSKLQEKAENTNNCNDLSTAQLCGLNSRCKWDNDVCSSRWWRDDFMV